MTRSRGSDGRDRRRDEPHRFMPRVWVFWYDETDDARYARGKCVSVSGSGMEVELYHDISANPGSKYLYFRVDGPKYFAGSAVVRHSRRRNMKLVLRLEFCGGLQWKPLGCSATDLVQLTNATERSSAET